MAISEFIKPLPKRLENKISKNYKTVETLRKEVFQFEARKREFLQASQEMKKDIEKARKTQNQGNLLEKTPLPELTYAEKQKAIEKRNFEKQLQNEEYIALLKQDMYYTEKFQESNRPTYLEVGKGKKKQLIPRESKWEYGESNRGKAIKEIRIIDMKRIESKPRKNGKTIVSYIPVTQEFIRYEWPMWGNSNKHYLNNNKPMSLSNPLFKLNPESGKLEITKLLNQRLTLWEMEHMLEVLQGVQVGESVMENLLSSPLVCERLSFFLKHGRGKNKELDNTPNKDTKKDGKRVKKMTRKSEIVVSMFSGDTRIMFYSDRTKRNSETNCKNYTPLAKYLIDNELVTGKKQVQAWFNKMKNDAKKTGKAITTQKWGYTIRFEFA